MSNNYENLIKTKWFDNSNVFIKNKQYLTKNKLFICNT